MTGAFGTGERKVVTNILEGELLYFRPMEERDVPHRVRWINDPEVRWSLNFDYPLSEVGTREWLRRVATDPSRKDFVVCPREGDDAPIGYAGFLNIDLRNGKAETYGGIGETSYWGGGYGTDLKRVQLRYAFREMGLNRVYAYVWAGNEAMIAVNEKCGLSVEGRLREDVHAHGEFRDRLVMSMLKDEFFRSELP